MVLRYLRSRISIPASISSTGKVVLFRKQASAGTFHRENKHVRPLVANDLQNMIKPLKHNKLNTIYSDLKVLLSKNL